MANFQSYSTPTISGLVITFNGSSNYDTATNGIVRSQFTTFRKAYITSAGGYSYTFSSFYPNDPIDPNANALIAPAYPSGHDSVVLPALTADGVYTCQLLTIPTYQSCSGYTFQIGNLVWDTTSSAIYQCIQLNTYGDGNVPSIPNSLYWTVITEAQALTNQTYSAIGYVYYIGFTQQCYVNTGSAAICNFSGGTCNIQSLCTNKNLLNAVCLGLLLNDIAYQVAQSNWNQVANDIAVAADICQCGTCGNTNGTCSCGC
jgi:hypothetical protein